MALKTFNIEEAIYKAYSKHCKNNGISMSHRVENFMREEIEKITKLSSKNIIGIEKVAKQIEKAVEHPLKKYC